jgi:hypothetical protein
MKHNTKGLEYEEVSDNDLNESCYCNEQTESSPPNKSNCNVMCDFLLCILLSMPKQFERIAGRYITDIATTDTGNRTPHR